MLEFSLLGVCIFSVWKVIFVLLEPLWTRVNIKTKWKASPTDRVNKCFAYRGKYRIQSQPPSWFHFNDLHTWSCNKYTQQVSHHICFPPTTEQRGRQKILNVMLFMLFFLSEWTKLCMHIILHCFNNTLTSCHIHFYCAGFLDLSFIYSFIYVILSTSWLRRALLTAWRKHQIHNTY